VDRRNLLKLAGTAAVARLASGCDKLVLLDDKVYTGLPPITPTDQFYIYACCGMPELDPATHETAVVHDGAGELARFDRAFLESLPAMEKEHTLECIGSTPRIQNIGNALWTGLPLIDVLDALGVDVPASAVGLRLAGMDEYDAGVPIEDLTRADGPIWLVWEMNGERLTPSHGAPARLLVPGKYGMKNLKWLREIAFVDTPHVSWWSTRGGWSEEAPYRPNTMIAVPREGSEIAAGESVLFLGTAYAGRDPVERVEISVDGGGWVDADLDYATGEPDIWVLWSFTWTAVQGDHTLQARCTTASGAQSVLDPEGTDRKKGYDGSMLLNVTVTA
jgi:hypothetical protein